MNHIDHDLTYVCPACSHLQFGYECELGSLGHRVHCKCRACGTMFSVLLDLEDLESPQLHYCGEHAELSSLAHLI